ncbi:MULTISPECIES: family 16 glycosylhydrolase [unclassified Streptomyces]|uniref:family 16 glycosylhydrolase n=1 Tax=unclassified Streptomyces TaxID=2593676 RepID=UPI000CD53331|nr:MULTISPECIES: family 16 glycosylhydrolase [unclassified Streptomyces]RPK43432.1 Beta-glucanase precursor [Streptomyces sp. ADI93-02]
MQAPLRRFSLFLALAAALLTFIALPTFPAQAAEVLLSQGKPATSSSTEGPFSARSAVDGDLGTRWSSAFADPQWIQIDLGASAGISRVVLNWEAAHGTAFRIEVSSDAERWTVVHQTTAGTGGTQNLAVSGNGRYVRMYGTQRATAYGYSLWEFQVYGTGGDPIQAPPLPSDPANPPRLVWSDEFDGAAGGKPGSAKWRADPGTGPNNELENYTDHRNAALDGAGHLVMEARKEVTAGSSCPRDPLSGSTTCQYTSARMNTGATFQFTYGRVEARIKVPKGNGLWPAFWMMGGDFLTGRPWPYNGEIDIMEILGKDVKTAYSTVHAPAYNGGGGIGAPYTLPGNEDFSDDFHTWVADWNSKGITYSLDGRTVLTLDKEQVEQTRGPWIFDHPHYLILNLAVGGDWPGPTDANTPFPARMLVDHVRVYQ